MAKSAKQVEVVISEKDTKKFVSDILQHFEAIESARGVYANRAAREKQGMQIIFETWAAKGVPQKSAKTHIRIIRLLQKAKSLMAELEADEAKMAHRLAKAQGERTQLSLWNDLPFAKPKAKRAPKLQEDDKQWSEAEPVGNA